MRLREIVAELLGIVLLELVDPVNRRLRDAREQLLDSDACMLLRRRLYNPLIYPEKIYSRGQKL